MRFGGELVRPIRVFISTLLSGLIAGCGTGLPAASPLLTDAPRLPPTVSPAPTPGPRLPETLSFAVFGQGPVVAHGKTGEWDGRYTDPGAVLFYDGRFHMFRNGFQEWPATVGVAYLTSSDGKTWTAPSDKPVMTTAEVSYARVAALASSALVEADGTWVLYFYTWDSYSVPARGAIGRATAKKPGGPWVPEKAPVLVPGSAGEWDDSQVSGPHVLRVPQGYAMYYTGSDAAGRARIGLATSADGVTWLKHNDPSTLSAPYAESDPVFSAGGDGQWDRAFVHQPRVFLTPAGWTMVYRAQATNDSPTMALGLATSPDGFRWARAASNPIFNPKSVPGATAFWFTNVVLREDVYYLFVEIDEGRSTDIYLATAPTGR